METPQSTKITTGIVRASYAHLFEPKASGKDGKGKLKYSVSLLIPKSDVETLEKVKKAIAAAEAQGMAQGGKWNGKKPKTYKDAPLRDGDDLDDEPKNEAYKGHFYINAKSDSKPGIVGLEKDENGKYKELNDPLQVYSGCYIRASVNAYPFDVDGNKGIAWGLNNVQKVRDGVPLGGGRSSAEDDFEEMDLDTDLLD